MLYQIFLFVRLEIGDHLSLVAYCNKTWWCIDPQSLCINNHYGLREAHRQNHRGRQRYSRIFL